MEVNSQARGWVSSEAKQRATRWLQDVPIPVQKGMCFNSCLSVTFLMSHTWERAPRTRIDQGHRWHQLYTCIQTSYLFPLNAVAASKQNQSLFSEDATFGDCQGKTESCQGKTEHRDVRAAVGCAGKSCRTSPAGAVCWKDMLWEQGQRGFCFSTKVAGTVRENTRRFSTFLVEKWKQVKKGSGDRMAWWGTATAELGVLSVKSRESEAIIKWDFICGCVFGRTGHPLHWPPCITIKHQTKALNLHLGQ